MFAIDGVKLPSNASKHRSGTRADFERQATKLEAATATMLQRHRETDAAASEPTLVARTERRITRLKHDAEEIREWLNDHPADRAGTNGTVRKSNRTDNESAKMATSKGVIQGYTGVAAVDGAHQIIVEAQAHGTGSEQALLLPVVTAMQDLLTPSSVITADAGYHSDANLQQLAALPVTALIADTEMRRRDERFSTQERHRASPDPLHDKTPSPVEEPQLFQPSDFTYGAAHRTCVCPAGKHLNRNGRGRVIRDDIWERFVGKKRDGGPCPLRGPCIRTPETTVVRAVNFFQGKTARVSTPTRRG